MGGDGRVYREGVIMGRYSGKIIAPSAIHCQVLNAPFTLSLHLRKR